MLTWYLQWKTSENAILSTIGALYGANLNYWMSDVYINETLVSKRPYSIVAFIFKENMLDYKYEFLPFSLGDRFHEILSFPDGFFSALHLPFLP